MHHNFYFKSKAMTLVLNMYLTKYEMELHEQNRSNRRSEITQKDDDKKLDIPSKDLGQNVFILSVLICRFRGVVNHDTKYCHAYLFILQIHLVYFYFAVEAGASIFHWNEGLQFQIYVTQHSVTALPPQSLITFSNLPSLCFLIIDGISPFIGFLPPPM